MCTSWIHCYVQKIAIIECFGDMIHVSLDHFDLFIPKAGSKIEIFKKIKKQLQGSWIFTCVPNIMIIGCCIAKWWLVTQTFCILGHFDTFSFYLFTFIPGEKLKKKLKTKKIPLEKTNSILFAKIYDYIIIIFMIII